jgi:hypothetical protein
MPNRRRKFYSYTSLLDKSDVKPLTQELNPSAKRRLTRCFTGDFASLTVHFVYA